MSDDHLFEQEPDWQDHWQGMPDYRHANMKPDTTLLVHFRNKKDRAAFAALVGQQISEKAKFIWHPEAQIEKAADKAWVPTEHKLPRYPIYIISKGRWDTRMTAKAFELAGVPYHIVVEPQEHANYAAVIDPSKILTLPFSNLGLGGIPARNWVWEHAISTGAKRHWIFDDNISGFCRFVDNLKVESLSGIFHCAIEDWCDRYENVAMAAFNYDYFAPRKMGSKIHPISLNTRCYSGILLRNDLTTVDGEPIRWRGRYNEDTDLSLRILKDGLMEGVKRHGGGRWCTALFNAFLMYKKPTLTMKGGNTDQLYAGAEATIAVWETHAATCDACRWALEHEGYDSNHLLCAEGQAILKPDGRWLMAESLREQHPECTTVERKWRRWQHQVDYRAFAGNELILRPDAAPMTGYDMTLEAMPEDDAPIQPVQLRRPEAAKPVPPPLSGPSALSFLARPEQPVPAVPSPARVEAPVVVLDAPTPTPNEPEVSLEADLATSELVKVFKFKLAEKGHRLLTRDGKFFVSESSTLTESERAFIKEHRDALIALAEPWTEAPLVVAVGNDGQSDAAVSHAVSSAVHDQHSLFVESSSMSMASFLGMGNSQFDANFVPDQPPDLTGISEVILNFATDGLDWARGAKPAGVTVSTMDGQLCRFLPFAFQGGGNLDEAAVKRWALEQLPGKKVTNANTRFDLHISRRWGVDLDEMGCTFSDVMHTAALLDDHRKRFALDLLAEDYLPDLPKIARVDETQHARYHASEVAEREKFTAELVWRLRDAMYPELDKQELRKVQALEDRVIPAVVEMEENGAPLDMELCHRWHKEVCAERDAILWEISKECGFAFEHTAAGWKRLIEHLHLPGTDSYAEDALDAYDHPLITKGQFASQLSNLDSKTFKQYLEKVGSDGILRFELNQLRGEDGGTITGRFSGPIQQVPNHDNHTEAFGERWFPRRLYVPAKGARYLAADAAQIQYRIFAHHANNPKIMAMYAKDPWASFHRMIEGLIRPYKPDLVYSHVKNMNFMKIFGGGLAKLALMMDYISKKDFVELSNMRGAWNDPRLAKAKEVQNIYDREMPEVGPLLATAMHLAKSKCDGDCNPMGKHADIMRKLHDPKTGMPHRGYVKTILGRRVRFPQAYRLHKAFCMVDQGSEADIMKEKIAQLHEARKHTNFLMRMTVHDEVSGDAREGDTLKKVDEVLNTQSFPQLRVPILFEMKQGENWAECK